jgi:hypothetical protein
MEYTEITEEIQKKYKDNPNACPFCGSEDISGGHFDAHDDAVYRDVQCQNPECTMTWTEFFTLTNIDNAFKVEEE